MMTSCSMVVVQVQESKSPAFRSLELSPFDCLLPRVHSTLQQLLADMAELPPQEPVALQPQSEKALGKRKLDDTPVVLAALVPGKNPPNPAPKPLKLAATRDKRVTRSSLGGGASAGGPSGSREGSVAQAEGAPPALALRCLLRLTADSVASWTYPI